MNLTENFRRFLPPAGLVTETQASPAESLRRVSRSDRRRLPGSRDQHTSETPPPHPYPDPRPFKSRVGSGRGRMRGQGRSCRLAAALGLPLLMLLSELPPASGTVPPLRLRGGSNRPFFMGKVRGGVAQRTSGLRPLFGGIQPSSSPKDLSSRSYPRGAAAAETASVPSSGRFRFRRMIQGRKFERMSDIFDRVAPPRNSGCQAVARPHREEQAGKRQQSELSPVVGDEDHHGWWDGGGLVGTEQRGMVNESERPVRCGGFGWRRRAQRLGAEECA